MSIDLNKVHDIITPSKPLGYLTNLAPGMSFWHDGTPTEDGTAVTAATVEVAAATGDITLSINGSADSRIGSSGVINSDGAAYNLAYETYNHVNAVSGWHCRLEGVLPSASIDHLLYTLTEESCFKRIVTATIGTTDADVHNLVISNRRMCTTGHGKSKKHWAIENEHGAVNKLGYLWLATDASAGGGDICVYSVGLANPEDQTDTFTETQLAEWTHASGAAQTEINLSSHPITARPGERLVITYTDAGDITTIDECAANGKSVIICE